MVRLSRDFNEERMDSVFLGEELEEPLNSSTLRLLKRWRYESEVRSEIMLRLRRLGKAKEIISRIIFFCG